MKKHKNILVDIFKAAIYSVANKNDISKKFPKRPKGNILVIGAGKASSSMASALESAWGNDLEGIVLTQYGYKTKTKNIQIIEANHPTPDKNGINGTIKIIKLIKKLKAKDTLVCLFSGGGSSLLTAPVQGVSLKEKVLLTKKLLECGADIYEINFIRKHLSLVKGGGIACMAYPAKVMTFLISDVIGDKIETIASGPTCISKANYSEALRILNDYKIQKPISILKHIRNSASKKQSDNIFNKKNIISIIANPQDALNAAAKKSKEYGFYPIILSDSMGGESTKLASFQASIIKQFFYNRQITKKPIIFLSGGETTVNLIKERDKYGKGGRNSEFILSLAIELNKINNYYAIACDTDGIDGSELNAGAYISKNTLVRARKIGISSEEYLKKHNSFEFFNQLNDLIVTGPTYTNVNDFRAILIY